MNEPTSDKCPFERIRDYPDCFQDCPDTDACHLSRSVQRRIAAQKGLPAPDFSKQDKEQELRERIMEAKRFELTGRRYQELRDALKNGADLSPFDFEFMRLFETLSLPEPHWNCPENCKHKMTTSGGSWDNSKIGGCHIGYKLPENIVLDIDNTLPICPFYRPEPPEEKVKIADKLWQDIQDCEGEIQRGQVDVMASEIAELTETLKTHPKFQPHEMLEAIATMVIQLGYTRQPEPELELLTDEELDNALFPSCAEITLTDRRIAQAQLDKDQKAIRGEK